MRLYKNRVLRICELKKDEIQGDWRKVHYEDLHNLYISLNFVKMIKS
jgi:hypothetical protein